MNVRSIHTKLGIAVLALSITLLGCTAVRMAPAGQSQSETRSVDAGAASSASVLLAMDAGKLNLTSGADQLMEATFTYNVPEWQPQVDYSVNGSQGNLAVTQPGTDNMIPVGRTVNNEWTVKLNSEMPLDLVIRTGAGEGALDLTGLDLTSLKVEYGAGNTNLDLSGNWDHDFRATIDGGVGNLSLTLPSEMGVRVNTATGLGGVTASGLTSSGNGYVNQAYGSAAHTLTVDVHTGVGAIDLTVP